MFEPKWPTHADGRNKSVGEMTKEERDRILQPIIKRLEKQLCLSADLKVVYEENKQ